MQINLNLSAISELENAILYKIQNVRSTKEEEIKLTPPLFCRT